MAQSLKLAEGCGLQGSRQHINHSTVGGDHHLHLLWWSRKKKSSNFKLLRMETVMYAFRSLDWFSWSHSVLVLFFFRELSIPHVDNPFYLFEEEAAEEQRRKRRRRHSQTAMPMITTTRKKGQQIATELTGYTRIERMGYSIQSKCCSTRHSVWYLCSLRTTR